MSCPEIEFAKEFGSGCTLYHFSIKCMEISWEAQMGKCEMRVGRI